MNNQANQFPFLIEGTVDFPSDYIDASTGQPWSNTISDKMKIHEVIDITALTPCDNFVRQL